MTRCSTRKGSDRHEARLTKAAAIIAARLYSGAVVVCLALTFCAAGVTFAPEAAATAQVKVANEVGISVSDFVGRRVRGKLFPKAVEEALKKVGLVASVMPASATDYTPPSDDDIAFASGDEAQTEVAEKIFAGYGRPAEPLVVITLAERGPYLITAGYVVRSEADVPSLKRVYRKVVPSQPPKIDVGKQSNCIAEKVKHELDGTDPGSEEGLCAGDPPEPPVSAAPPAQPSPPTAQPSPPPTPPSGQAAPAPSTPTPGTPPAGTPPASSPQTGAPQTGAPQSSAGGGMLDDITDTGGQMVVIPGGGGATTTTPTSPPAAAPPGATKPQWPAVTTHDPPPKALSPGSAVVAANRELIVSAFKFGFSFEPDKQGEEVAMAAFTQLVQGEAGSCLAQVAAKDDLSGTTVEKMLLRLKDSSEETVVLPGSKSEDEERYSMKSYDPETDKDDYRKCIPANGRFAPREIDVRLPVPRPRIMGFDLSPRSFDRVQKKELDRVLTATLAKNWKLPTGIDAFVIASGLRAIADNARRQDRNANLLDMGLDEFWFEVGGARAVFRVEMNDYYVPRSPVAVAALVLVQPSKEAWRGEGMMEQHDRDRRRQ